MAFPILGSPIPAFFDSSGSPLASGTLSVLDPADDTNKASYPTYDDAQAKTNANSNPITLNSRGEVPNGLWGRDGEDYKLILKDSGGTTIWTVDDVFLPGAAATSNVTKSVGTASLRATGIAPTITDTTVAFSRDATVVEDFTLDASASASATNNNNVLAALIGVLQGKGVI